MAETGFTLTREALFRMSRAVRWVEAQIRTTGTGGNNRRISQFSIRVLRTTEEVCDGYYKAIELGWVNSEEITEATWFSWKNLPGGCIFDDDAYADGDRPGIHSGLAMEINQRENIPIGTIIYAIQNAKLDDVVTIDSEYSRETKWIFQWNGNEGDFMANPYWDADGFRYFQINAGCVQIGNVETVVGQQNIQVDNTDACPSDTPSGSPTPTPSPSTAEESDWYYVEVTFTFDSTCEQWVPAINDQLQMITQAGMPDKWVVVAPSNGPSPDQGCPQTTESIIWRLIVGEVFGQDWIQHYCGAMQYPLFPGGGGAIVPSASPTQCEGFDGTRVTTYSGRVIPDPVDELLYQEMITRIEVWDFGKLCNYADAKSLIVIGSWCCPEASPIPSNARPSDVPSDFPSPSTGCIIVCIKSDWDIADLNGEYVYNSGTDTWKQTDGLGEAYFTGSFWYITHPLSDNASDYVYKGTPTGAGDDCPGDATTWVFVAPNGTETFVEVTEGLCTEATIVCVLNAGWSEVSLDGDYTYSELNGRWEKTIGAREFYIFYSSGNEQWELNENIAGVDCVIYTNPAGATLNPPETGWVFNTDTDNCGGSSTADPTVYTNGCPEVPTDGLQALYYFNGDVTDEQGNYDLTNSGLTFVNESFGEVGEALSNGNHADVFGTPSWTEHTTMFFWKRTASIGVNTVIYQTGGGDWFLTSSGGFNNIRIWGGTYTLNQSALNTWYCLALKRNSSNGCTLYKAELGDPTMTQVTTFTKSNSASNWGFGTSSFSNVGRWNNAAIWNRELSDDEINEAFLALSNTL